ncbi:hypothetical protein [Candidatus Bealeia paramacronuclearis]
MARKKSNLQNALYSLSLGVAALYASGASAKISPLAFKGITKYFKKEQELYSPTLGEIALDVKLIGNLRFYGDFENGVKADGTRNYIDDRSQDPTWRLVKLLFPSPAGNLSTETNADTNFGKYVTDPKVMSAVMNFSYDMRHQEKPNPTLIPQTLNNILDMMDSADEEAQKLAISKPLQGLREENTKLFEDYQKLATDEAAPTDKERASGIKHELEAKLQEKLMEFNWKLGAHHQASLQNAISRLLNDPKADVSELLTKNLLKDGLKNSVTRLAKEEAKLFEELGDVQLRLEKNKNSDVLKNMTKITEALETKLTQLIQNQPQSANKNEEKTPNITMNKELKGVISKVILALQETPNADLSNIIKSNQLASQIQTSASALVKENEDAFKEYQEFKSDFEKLKITEDEKGLKTLHVTLENKLKEFLTSQNWNIERLPKGVFGKAIRKLQENPNAEVADLFDTGFSKGELKKSLKKLVEKNKEEMEKYALLKKQGKKSQAELGQMTALVAGLNKKLLTALQGKKWDVNQKLEETVKRAIEALGDDPAADVSYLFNETLFRGKFQAVGDVLKALEAAEIQEKTLGEKSIYPKGTPEQILNSFFCEKFNTQEDLFSFIGGLRPEIVDKMIPVPSTADPLKKEELDGIAAKTDKNIDDLYDLSQASFFYRSIPFKSGVTPVSNGDTKFYDRKSGRLLTATFQNCVETSMIQFLSMVFFNPEKKVYDLEAVEKHIKSLKASNPFFENVRAFFTTEYPENANAGDIVTRSKGNKIFGDLNALNDQVKDGIHLEYKKKIDGVEAELQAGHIHFMRVFQKLFSLPLGDFPKATNEKGEKLSSQAQLEVGKTWLSDSFATLFKILDPTRSYEVNSQKLKYFSNEIEGPLEIRSSTSSDQSNFSFRIHSYYNLHSYIDSIQDSQQDGNKSYVFLEQSDLNKNNNKAEGIEVVLNNELEAVPTMETFRLLAQKTTFPFLYQLFSEGLVDNDSRIRFIKKLCDFNTQKIEPYLPYIKNSLSHVLESIGWDDPYISQRASPFVMELLEKKEFQDVLFKKVRSLDFSYETKQDELILKDFKGLIVLCLSRMGFPPFKKIVLEGLPSLTNINASDAKQLEEIEINQCGSVKSIKLSNTKVSAKSLEALKSLPQLEVLILSETYHLEHITWKNFSSLKKLYLNQTYLKKIELENLPFLTVFHASRTKKLESFVIKKGLNYLKEVEFYKSNIRELIGLEESSIETMDLSETAHLESLNVSGMKFLKKLDLKESGIKRLTAKDASIEELLLKSTKNLEEVNVSGMKFLKKLDLEESGIKRFTAKDASIEELLLKSTKNLEEVNVSGVKSLKKLYFESSSIKQITAEESSIEELFLLQTQNLEKLDVAGMKSLKRIIAAYDTGIREIKGLEDSNIETLIVRDAKNLREINIANAKKLKYLDFQGSGIQKFTGLKESTIQDMNLSHTQNLKELDVSGMKYLEKLNLEGSEIKQITFGLESKIKSLFLKKTSLDQGSLKQFSKLRSLEEIDVTGVTDEISLHNSIKNSLKITGQAKIKWEDE